MNHKDIGYIVIGAVALVSLIGLLGGIGYVVEPWAESVGVEPSNPPADTPGEYVALGLVTIMGIVVGVAGAGMALLLGVAFLWILGQTTVGLVEKVVRKSSQEEENQQSASR